MLRTWEPMARVVPGHASRAMMMAIDSTVTCRTWLATVMRISSAGMVRVMSVIPRTEVPIGPR